MENPTLPTNWLAALSNANHDGIQTFLISGIGNETGRFYLGFPKDSDVCDQDDLGFQESGQEAGAARSGFRNLHFPCLSRSPSSTNMMTK